MEFSNSQNDQDLKEAYKEGFQEGKHNKLKELIHFQTKERVAFIKT